MTKREQLKFCYLRNYAVELYSALWYKKLVKPFHILCEELKMCRASAGLWGITYIFYGVSYGLWV